MPSIKVSCSGMKKEMQLLGLQRPNTELTKNETALWTSDQSQAEAILKRVAENNLEDIARCLRAFPQSTNKILFQITVDRSGSVLHAEPENEPHADSQLTSCMADAIREWTYPPHLLHQPLTVVFPFSFTEDPP